MKIIALLMIFISSSSYSRNLNLIEMYSLRNAHEITPGQRGKTGFSFTGNKKIFDLKDEIDSQEIERVNSEMEYSYPYFLALYLEQRIIISEYTINFRVQNNLIANISNPVFPELQVFNIRSDMISFEKVIHLGEFLIRPRVLIFNKWYNEKNLSLENFVKEQTDLDMKEGKTYNPIYLDLHMDYSNFSQKFNLNFIGYDLFSKDKYNYLNSEFIHKYSLSNNFSLGYSLSPLYQGEYKISNTLAAVSQYTAKYFDLSMSLSRILQNFTIKLDLNRFLLNVGYLRIKKSNEFDYFNESINLKLEFLY